jgi:hypothetical protein
MCRNGLAAASPRPSRSTGIAAREKYIAAPLSVRTTFTTLRSVSSSAAPSGAAAVPTAAPGVPSSARTAAVMTSPAISGSSPCAFTITWSAPRPSSAAASANRLVPFGWSARVITTCVP